MLDIDAAEQIFDELCDIILYEPQSISMHTVSKWVKAFKARKLSVKDDTHLGRPKISITKANNLTPLVLQ